MADDDIRNTSEGSQTYHVGAKLSGAQAKSAANTFRQSTTAGAGLGKKEKSAGGMPKQDTGESVSDYSARLRKWREGTPVLEGQKKALTSMVSK